MREVSTGPDAAEADLEDHLVRLRIEEAIAALDGIEAVRLVPGTNRPVDELHVVARSDRDPKNTARDLQSLLLANFGVDVDRRVISVVRLGDDAGKRLRDGLPRLALGGVRIELRGDETLVTVDLHDGDERLQGESGPTADGQLVEAASEATLEAIAGQRTGTTLRLLGATIAQVGTEHVALAAVVATGGRTRDLLTGSAVVRRHEADAAARAVLDATNRLQRHETDG